MSPDISRRHGVTHIQEGFALVKDKLLAIGEVLPFIMTANPDDLEYQIIWYGAGYPNTPLSQFHTALETEFPALSEEDKAAVLSRGLRFATLDFTRKTSETVRNPNWRGVMGETTYHYQLYAGGAFKPKGQDYLRNFSAYLLTILEYTGGDLRAAREILTTAPYSGSNDTRIATGTLACFLYKAANIDRKNDPDKETVTKGHAIKAKFQSAHPKARALAFIADAYLGNFNLEGVNADINLDKVLSENDPALITQVLVYLRQQLATAEPGYGKTQSVVARAIGYRKHLYETVKERFPGSQFVLEYEAIQNELRLRKLESRIADGRIHPNDLAQLLTRNPNLLNQVRERELVAAIDATNDHGVATTLQRFLQIKKSSANNQTS